MLILKLLSKAKLYWSFKCCKTISSNRNSSCRWLEMIETIIRLIRLIETINRFSFNYLKCSPAKFEFWWFLISWSDHDDYWDQLFCRSQPDSIRTKLFSWCRIHESLIFESYGTKIAVTKIGWCSWMQNWFFIFSIIHLMSAYNELLSAVTRVDYLCRGRWETMLLLSLLLLLFDGLADRMLQTMQCDECP